MSQKFRDMGEQVYVDADKVKESIKFFELPLTLRHGTLDNRPSFDKLSL